MRASSTMGPQLLRSTLYSSILGLSPGFSGSHLSIQVISKFSKWIPSHPSNLVAQPWFKATPTCRWQ